VAAAFLLARSLDSFNSVNAWKNENNLTAVNS